jgi:uncharacterized protein (TIGR02284 family)
MTDMNKEAISVLNDLIETSKDGQEGFKTCAEDIKHPELKTLFVHPLRRLRHCRRRTASGCSPTGW